MRRIRRDNPSRVLGRFLQRSYAMRPSAIGFWPAAAMGVATASGALLGGAAASRLDARRARGGLWLSFWTTLASAPVLTCAFVTDQKSIALACIMGSGVLGSVCVGPVYSTVQALANARTRATAAAVFGVANSLLGQVLGPLLVGAVSDLAARSHGRDSLRFSLEIVSLIGVWPAVHLFYLARGSSSAVWTSSLDQPPNRGPGRLSMLGGPTDRG